MSSFIDLSFVFAVISCPPLKVNKILKVMPESCSLGDQLNGTVCKYECTKGFKLYKLKQKSEKKLDAEDPGWRLCTPQGTWTDTGVPITCRDVEIPKFTYCPGNLTVPTSHRMASALVHWHEPVAVDNGGAPPGVFLDQDVLYFGQKIFTIGDTKVHYVAQDGAGLKDDCIFYVKVYDVESPLIIYCPLDIEVYYNEREKSVFWTEPQFKDNSNLDVYIYKSRSPGDMFSWGPASEVIYTATDISGNTAVCRFNVKVKPYNCPFYSPPENGALSCDEWVGGQYCTVQCQEGFDFPYAPADVYYCRQMEGFGVWEPGSLQGETSSSPWPDCSQKRHPNEAKMGIKMHYYTGDCATKKTKFEIQANYLDTLQLWTPFLEGIYLDFVAV